jgi:predicted homoserine dehydrogenase-like protein
VSLERELLPLGLAHNVKLKSDIAEGQSLRWSDVAYDPNDLAVKIRREMEATFGRRNVGAEAVT